MCITKVAIGAVLRELSIPELSIYFPHVIRWQRKAKCTKQATWAVDCERLPNVSLPEAKLQCRRIISWQVWLRESVHALEQLLRKRFRSTWEREGNSYSVHRHSKWEWPETKFYSQTFKSIIVTIYVCFDRYSRCAGDCVTSVVWLKWQLKYHRPQLRMMIAPTDFLEFTALRERLRGETVVPRR